MRASTLVALRRRIGPWITYSQPQEDERELILSQGQLCLDFPGPEPPERKEAVPPRTARQVNADAIEQNASMERLS